MTFIIGAGGHGKVIKDILESSGIDLTGYVDDFKRSGTLINGVKVVSDVENFLNEPGHKEVVLGIGDNTIRSQIYKKCKERNIEIIAAIHSQAIISKSAELGEGVVIMPGVVIGPNVSIGRGVIINTGSTVDHDCIVEDWGHISPGVHLAGSVSVGKLTHIGIGANILNNISIGAGCRIGAGAAVINDVPDELTVVGVPAKELAIER